MSSERDASREVARVVGAVFRAAREEQRLSQEQVAAFTKGRPWQLSRSAISDIERGRSLPGLEAAITLSRVLHVDLAELVDRADLASGVPVDLTGISLDDVLRRGRSHFLDGDFRDAVRAFDAAIERLALDPPQPQEDSKRRETRAILEIDRAVALRRCNALQAAHASAEQAVELSEGRRDLSARAYIVWASVLALENKLAMAQVAAREAVSLAAEVDEDLQGQAWNQQGNVLYRAGKIPDAEGAFLEARALFSRSGNRRHQIKVEGNLGSCMMVSGRMEQAETHFRMAIDLALEYRDLAAQSMWLVTLGRLRLQADRLAEAEQLAVEALGIARPREDTLTIFRAEWLRHLLVRRQRPSEPDERRLALLWRLHRRLAGHDGLTEVQEFLSAAVVPERRRGGRT